MDISLLLHLFGEFFIIGLFSVGGGLATIPFLTDLAERTGWFSLDQLTNMIAISESTPGPLGVNMASYVGFSVAGIPGGIMATLGLICPCIVIILMIAGCLAKFRHNAVVEGIFYGLRPASTGLIAAAGWSVICLSLIQFSRTNGDFWPSSVSFCWPCIILACIVFLLTHLKWTKKCHPVLWIVLSAVAGVVLSL